MPKTWKQIKEEALQLMFAFQNGKIDATDPDTIEYMAAMPAAANAALRELAAVRPIVRVLSIPLYAPRRRIMEDMRKEDEDVVVPLQKAQAYYFEVDDPAEIHLERVEPDGWREPVRRICNDQRRRFTSYKGIVEQGEGDAQLRFSGAYAYNIRRIVLYDEPFPTADDVPDYAGARVYDIRKMVDAQGGLRFMRLDEIAPVRMGDRNVAAHTRYDGAGRLYIDPELMGEVDVYYNAYPTAITPDTPDDFILEPDDETLDAVPLYMAGRLFAVGEADRAQAVYYMNQYEAKKEWLAGRNLPCGYDGFVSESGWC